LHFPNHPFIIIEQQPPPLFEEGWTAEEEIVLLSAIERCGFGNWTGTSGLMKTKGPLECEVHYLGIYLRGDNGPHPPEAGPRPQIPMPPPPTYDTAPAPSRPLAESSTSMTDHKMGYMARRREFLTEYCEEAEEILSGLTFDDVGGFDQTMEALALYSGILEERAARMRVVEEWKLHDGPVDVRNPFQLPDGPVDVRKLGTDLATLAPYLGKTSTFNLVRALWRMGLNTKTIRTRKDWQRHGVKIHAEGFLMNGLQRCLEGEGEAQRVAPAKEKTWNDEIAAYDPDSDNSSGKAKEILTEKEMELVHNRDIPRPLFFAMKDLLIREYTARGGLSLEEALELVDPKYHQHIEVVWELFVSLGWINE
jgi:transcriptional adapter 2-alpha